MTQPPVKRPNWRLLIPVFMLILAALACDEPYIDPPHVKWVEVDPDTPGYAYAYVTSETSAIDAAYETRDFGQHWLPSTHTFSTADSNGSGFAMNGDSLKLNGREIWSFPRPVFRFFFLDDTFSVNTPQFGLPYNKVSAGTQGDTVYAAMGTQGVLVGRLTNNGTLADWQITANGMDTLNPLPLTITEPMNILGILAFALFVPPFGLIHGFLLYCVWRYLLPREKARLYAIFTTLFLMLVAALGIVIWLTDVRTDYFPVVGVVSAITALTGVSLTLFFANGQPDTLKKVWLALGALVASLIVPAGVATIFVGWWAVYVIVFGYLFFRRAYFSYFQPEEGNWHERWLADRLALETLGLGAGIIAVMFLILSFVQRIALLLLGYGILKFQSLGYVVTLVVMVVLIKRFVNWRLGRMAEKLKRDDDREAILPPRASFRLAVLGWVAASVLASAGTFIGQVIAQGWFVTLLK